MCVSHTADHGERGPILPGYGKLHCDLNHSGSFDAASDPPERVESHRMQTVSLTVALLAILLFYGGPFLIVGVWLARWRQRPESPRWRWAMSWVSLSLATVALGAWIGTFSPIPQNGGAAEGLEQFRRGVTTTLTFLSGAFVAALIAKGKGRAWTVASALIIPLQCLMWFGSASIGR